MPSEQIQWFPGHMAKTRRLITENLSAVDIIIELLDARIPYSSKNPEILRLAGEKPILTLLNKASLADPAASLEWIKYYAYNGGRCCLTDCMTGEGFGHITDAVNEILAAKRQRYDERGMTGRSLKAMILGIPNVGKSSLINRLCGNKKAKVEDRPGVTLSKQWVGTSIGLDLLDMPGVLWPKFEDRIVGENLAATGAINDKILDSETIAVALISRLRSLYPALLALRYKLDAAIMNDDSISDYDVFLNIGRRRGFLVSGGEIDGERTALTLLDEFRGAKIGRITLERPKVKKKNA